MDKENRAYDPEPEVLKNPLETVTEEFVQHPAEQENKEKTRNRPREIVEVVQILQREFRDHPYRQVQENGRENDFRPAGRSLPAGKRVRQDYVLDRRAHVIDEMVVDPVQRENQRHNVDHKRQDEEPDEDLHLLPDLPVPHDTDHDRGDR